jgi:hypothetical protein
LITLRVVWNGQETSEEYIALSEYYECVNDNNEIKFSYTADEVQKQHSIKSIPYLAKCLKEKNAFTFVAKCSECDSEWEERSNGKFGRWEIAGKPFKCPACNKSPCPDLPDEDDEFDGSNICQICSEFVKKGEIVAYHKVSGSRMHMTCFHNMKKVEICSSCSEIINDHEPVHIGHGVEFAVFHDRCFHDLRKFFYDQYLQTEHWKELSEKVKDRAGRKCQVCNSRNNLNAHHRTYERLGEEHDDDLICLCSSCHELFSKNGRIEK